MRNYKRYPPNWRKRAPQDRARLGNKCVDCQIEHGTKRMTFAGDFRPVWLQRHHPDEDPWNEHARIELLCPRCHFKRHYEQGHLPSWLIEVVKHRKLLGRA